MKLNDLNMNFGLTVRKTEVVKDSKSLLAKMNEAYDEHAKLVFLFDVSGSMNERVARSFTEQYLWTPELVAAIRTRVAAAVATVNHYLTTMDPFAVVTPEDEEVAKMSDDQRGPNGELSFTPASDEDVKERVVRHELLTVFAVPVDFARKHQIPSRRIDLVKKMAKQEIEKRFKKFPNSRIAVIPFDNGAKAIFDDGKPELLWPALEKMSPAGGTDILGAIREGMDVCRRKPSTVGIHHFIIVSDGEDYNAGNTIGEWVPALKASGVVMDYIHIGDRNPNPGIKAACEALGGECVTVNSERDFEERFIAAVERKMLPCGS